MVNNTDLQTLMTWIKNCWKENEIDDFFSLLLSLNIYGGKTKEKMRNLIMKKMCDLSNEKNMADETKKREIETSKEQIESLKNKLSNIDNYVILNDMVSKENLPDNNKIKNINNKIEELHSQLDELVSAKIGVEKQILSYENDINSLKNEKEDLMKKIISSGEDEKISQYDERVKKIAIEEDDIKNEMSTQKNFLLDFDATMDEIKIQISEQENKLKKFKKSISENDKKTIETQYDNLQIQKDKEQVSILESEIESAYDFINKKDELDYLKIFDSYLEEVNKIQLKNKKSENVEKEKKVNDDVIEKYNIIMTAWNSESMFNRLVNKFYNNSDIADKRRFR